MRLEGTDKILPVARQGLGNHGGQRGRKFWEIPRKVRGRKPLGDILENQRQDTRKRERNRQPPIPDEAEGQTVETTETGGGGVLPSEELSAMSRPRLLEYAKERGLTKVGDRGLDSSNKKEIVEALTHADNSDS